MTFSPSRRKSSPLPGASPGSVGYRTSLATPLLRQGVVDRNDQHAAHGRSSHSPTGQIQLLETFADQAVIAIENARLFGELESRTHELADSVEELQALGVVSQAVSSTLDLQHVLTTVLSTPWISPAWTAAPSSSSTRQLASSMIEQRWAWARAWSAGPCGRRRCTSVRACWVGPSQERQPMQVADIQEEGTYFSRLRETLIQAGYRAMLAVPLLREDQVIGGLVVRRGTPGEVPPKTVELLQTFASQSALAIQNARLFNEIEEKSRQLEEASQHKSQFLANMSPRAAHAAQRHPRLHRADPGRDLRRRAGEDRRDAGAGADQRAAPAGPDQRRAGPEQDGSRPARPGAAGVRAWRM